MLLDSAAIRWSSTWPASIASYGFYKAVAACGSQRPVPRRSGTAEVQLGRIGISGPAYSGSPRVQASIIPICRWERTTYIELGRRLSCLPAGCNSGFEVVRIPLSQIQAGGTIFFDYTTPSDSSLAWGSHITQDTGNQVFWGGTQRQQLTASVLASRGIEHVLRRTIGISSWPNNTLSSTTPDGQDRLKFGFPGNGLIGATRSSNQIWFAWMAGTNNNFAQPHIQIVTLDRSNSFQKTQQVQIGTAASRSAIRPSPRMSAQARSAFRSPTAETATMRITPSESGAISSSSEPPTVVWELTGSEDYLTIRQNPSVGLFDAFGYGISNVTGVGMQSDVRYVVFGRSCVIR